MSTPEVNFRPETLELARRLLADQEAGRPIDDADRERLRLEMAAARSPFLQAVIDDKERPWRTLYSSMGDDQRWNCAAKMVLAMILNDEIRVAENEHSKVVDILMMWDLGGDLVDDDEDGAEVRQ